MENNILYTDSQGNLHDSIQTSGVLDISDLSRKEIKNLAKKAAGWSGENGTFSWKDVASGQANIHGKITRHEDLFKRKFNKQLEKNLHHTEQQALLNAAKEGDTKALGQYVASKRDDVAPAIGAVTLLPATMLAGLSTGAFAAGVNGLKTLYSNPFLRLGLDITGSVDGINNAVSGNGVRKTIKLAKEGDTWGTIKSGTGDVLDILGISDLARIGSKFNKANRALHALDVIEPTDYRRPFKRGVQWMGDIISDKPVDLDNLSWRKNPQYSIDKLGEQFLLRGESRVYAARPDATAAEKALANEIGLNAREDALRMYLGFPQKYDTYIPNGDGTFSYNIEKLKDTGFKFEGFGQNYDYLTTNAGNWKSNGVRDIATNGSSTYSIHSVEDVWDLNPFQSSKLPFLRKIEAGKVIGGKPFILKMDIPLTSFSDKPPVLGHIK